MIELGADVFLKQGPKKDDLCPLDIFFIRLKPKEKIALVMKAALCDAWQYGKWISLAASEENSNFASIPSDCRNLISKLFFTLEPYESKILEFSNYQ